MFPLKLIGDETFEGSDLVKIHTPESVEELGDRCFYECKSLSRVTFGQSSSLKLIRREAFGESDVIEIHIHDGFAKLGDRCFYECKSLSRVTFGRDSHCLLF